MQKTQSGNAVVTGLIAAAVIVIIVIIIVTGNKKKVTDETMMPEGTTAGEMAPAPTTEAMPTATSAATATGSVAQ